MKEQFKRGDYVEVAVDIVTANQSYTSKWMPAIYVAYVHGKTNPHVVEFPEFTYSALSFELCRLHKGGVKQNAPEPTLIDIEQPKPGTIEYLQEQVEFLQGRLIELELKFEAKKSKKTKQL